MPLKNWAQLKDDAKESGQSFEPLPDGDYDFKIIASEHRKSQSQKDGYNITAEVESGPYKGRRVWNTFWVSPDSAVAMGIFFRQFAALGLDGTFFDSEPSDEQIVGALVGKRFRGTVTTREWNGNKNNEIKNVAKATGPAPAPASNVSLDDVAAHASSPSVNAAQASNPGVVSTPSAPSGVASPSAPANPWGSTGVPSVPSGAPEKPF